MDPLPEGDNITTQTRTYEFGNEELWQYYKGNQALRDMAGEQGNEAEARRQEINRRKMVFATRFLPTGNENVHVYSSNEMLSLCQMKTVVPYYGWAIAQVGLEDREYRQILTMAVTNEVKCRTPNRSHVPEPNNAPF